MGKDIRRMLTHEERVEYDQLLYAATHFADGSRRPSGDVGPEMLRLLEDAVKAQRKWATWVLNDSLCDGLRTRGVKWANAHKKIEATVDGIRRVTKAAARGVRKRDDEGRTVHQQTLWEDMYAEDLDQVMRRAGGQIVAERENIAIARRLADLIAKTGRVPVAEALAAAGLTLEQFLSQDEELAS